VKPGKWIGNAFPIEGMVEKPKREAAPSNLIISGRYILQPEIFAEIEKQEPGAGGEIQITDAMIRLQAQQKFFGVKFEGTTYDCGDKVGFLAANVALGLERPDIGPAFRKALEGILGK
ncbi:MAG: sugar phosphate nucleotidyltransferase, partial [Parvibaculaceae bacterium]